MQEVDILVVTGNVNLALSPQPLGWKAQAKGEKRELVCWNEKNVVMIDSWAIYHNLNSRLVFETDAIHEITYMILIHPFCCLLFATCDFL